MAITNIIIKCSGRRWMVREAISLQAACNAIASARCSGSIGSTHIRNDRFIGGTEYVEARVVQINSDGTERQPYTEAY